MPFCPKCKYEYKEGIEMCSDCGVPLVKELTTEECEAAPEYTFESTEEVMTDFRRSEAAPKYVNSYERADNYKSGAGVLLGVGVVGIVMLLLMNLDIIKLPINGFTGTLVNLVMGALFIIFIWMGIHSHITYKKLTQKAKEEDNLEAEVSNWCLNEMDKSLLEENVSSDDTDEIKFFNRTEALRTQIKASYPNLEESFLEHIVEMLYDRIFE